MSVWRGTLLIAIIELHWWNVLLHRRFHRWNHIFNFRILFMSHFLFDLDLWLQNCFKDRILRLKRSSWLDSFRRIVSIRIKSLFWESSFSLLINDLASSSWFFSRVISNLWVLSCLWSNCAWLWKCEHWSFSLNAMVFKFDVWHRQSFYFLIWKQVIWLICFEKRRSAYDFPRSWVCL